MKTIFYQFREIIDIKFWSSIPIAPDLLRCGEILISRRRLFWATNIVKSVFFHNKLLLYVIIVIVIFGRVSFASQCRQ